MMSFAFHMIFIALLIGQGLPSSTPSPSHTTLHAPSQNGVILNEVAIGSFVVSCLVVVFSLYRKKTDKLVKRVSSANLPTAWGTFVIYCYKSVSDGLEHVAMVKGETGNGKDVLVRVHSECLTGDIFMSTRCDCGNQLALAMQQIEKAGRGVVVYLKGHEGRGIGLGSKLRAYNLQDDGRDTVQANEDLGLPVDRRDYGVGAQILKDLGVRTIKLMTNNPAKCDALKRYGLQITARVPVITPITKHNKRYLETKRTRMGHVYGTETERVIS